MGVLISLFSTQSLWWYAFRNGRIVHEIFPWVRGQEFLQGSPENSQLRRNSIRNRLKVNWDSGSHHQWLSWAVHRQRIHSPWNPQTWRGSSWHEQDIWQQYALQAQIQWWPRNTNIHRGENLMSPNWVRYSLIIFLPLSSASSYSFHSSLVMR